MIHEDVGDAFIDAVIPSIYSAFIVIGAILYDLSLYAVFIPFSLLIAILWYRKYVYVPSLKAVNERKIITAQENLENPIKDHFRKISHKNTPVENFRRGSTGGGNGSNKDEILIFLRKCFYGFQRAVANCSEKNIIESMRKNAKINKKWSSMNIPESHVSTNIRTYGRRGLGSVHEQNSYRIAPITINAE